MGQVARLKRRGGGGWEVSLRQVATTSAAEPTDSPTRHTAVNWHITTLPEYQVLHLLSLTKPLLLAETVVGHHRR